MPKRFLRLLALLFALGLVLAACGGGGTQTDFVWVALEPADQTYHVVFGVQITTQPDVEALERALDTFVVDV